MLDLVKDETERIDSRFLEPACGKRQFPRADSPAQAQPPWNSNMGNPILSDGTTHCLP
jgi:hypothetical protein